MNVKDLRILLNAYSVEDLKTIIVEMYKVYLKD